MRKFLAVAILCVIGCSDAPDKLDQRFDSIKTGMTVAEADQLLGPSVDIPREQLPANFEKVYTVEPAAKFRRWRANATGKQVTIFAEIKDGKLTSSRLIDREQETKLP